MLNEDSKFEIALDLVEFQIGACLSDLEKEDNMEVKALYKKLVNAREEIYKGNEKVIEEIIRKAREV